MMILWLIAYLLIILLLGYALLSIARGATRERLVELAGTTIALGCGGVGWLLLIASMVGVKPQRAIVLAAFVAAMVCVAVLFRRKRLPRVALPLVSRIALPVMARVGWSDLLTIFGAVLIGAQLYAATRIAVLPTFEVDAYSIWGLKAKVMYFEPLTPKPEYFSDLSLSYSHLDYPLLVPALWSGSYAMMGGIDDSIAKLVLILPVVALSALLYASARDHVDRLRAMLLTAVATGLPIIGAYAGRGVADAEVAMFFLASISTLVRWIEHRRIADAVILGAFVGWGVLTKLEGNPFAVSCAIVVTALAAWKRRSGWWRHLLAFGLSLLITVGPWLIWSRDLPRTHENYQARLTLGAVVENLDKLDDVLRGFWSQARLWYYTVPLAVLLLSAIIGWRRWREPSIVALWFVLLVQLCAYVVVFLVTPWEIEMLAPFSLHRLFFHLAPIAMLLAALHGTKATFRATDVARK